MFGHLTNVAFGKRDPNFRTSDTLLTDIEEYFEEHGVKLAKIWKDIADIVVKSVIACESDLKAEVTKHEKNR